MSAGKEEQRKPLTIRLERRPLPDALECLADRLQDPNRRDTAVLGVAISLRLLAAELREQGKTGPAREE